MNLAVYISGTGSNFLAIQHAIDKGQLSARIVVVVSNNENAVGLKKAEQLDIPTAIFDRKTFTDGSQFAKEMFEMLHSYGVNVIVLAGYLRKLPPHIVRAFPGRIVNIHPALLPRFGGKGMYGIHVHEAVLASGSPETGVTVQFVDEDYDRGAIIAQRRVPVLPDDSPETLQKRVLQQEHIIYSEVLEVLSIQK